MLVVISCNSHLQGGKGDQYKRVDNSFVHHNSNKFISIVLHWSFTGSFYSGKKRKGGGSITFLKSWGSVVLTKWVFLLGRTFPTAFSEEEGWYRKVSTLRSSTSSYHRKKAQDPSLLGYVKISTKPGEQNLHEPGLMLEYAASLETTLTALKWGEHFETQVLLSACHKVGLPSIRLWATGGPPSDTLWATLPSLTLLDWSSKITSEQWVSSEGK